MFMYIFLDLFSSECIKLLINMLGLENRWLILILILQLLFIIECIHLYSDEKSRLGKDCGSVYERMIIYQRMLLRSAISLKRSYGCCYCCNYLLGLSVQWLGMMQTKHCFAVYVWLAQLHMTILFPLLDAVKLASLRGR